MVDRKAYLSFRAGSANQFHHHKVGKTKHSLLLSLPKNQDSLLTPGNFYMDNSIQNYLV